MSYREKMEKKIPQGKKTVVMQSLLDDKGNVLRVSYIYPILWRFGLIRVPKAIEKKMGKQR